MTVTERRNVQPRHKMEISSGLRFLLVLHLTFSRNAEGLKVKQPETATAEAGKSVTLTCSFMSETDVFSVIWTVGCNSTEHLQDHPIFQHRVKFSTEESIRSSQNSTVHTYEGKSIFTIFNLTENDSVTFCCQIKTVRKKGCGRGTRVEVIPRSFPTAVCTHNMVLLVEIIRITSLVILIILLGLAVKKSC